MQKLEDIIRFVIDMDGTIHLFIIKKCGHSNTANIIEQLRNLTPTVQFQYAEP